MRVEHILPVLSRLKDLLEDAQISEVMDTAEKKLKSIKTKQAASLPNTAAPSLSSAAAVISEINSALSQVQFESLSYVERDTLTKVGYFGVVSPSTIRDLDLLIAERASVETIFNRVASLKRDLNELLRKTNQLTKLLPDFVDDGFTSDLEEGYGLLEVTFTRGAAMGDVEALKKWADKWHTIGRGYALVFDKAPQDLKVTHVANGSVILTFAGLSVLIRSLAKSANLILDALIKIQKLKDNARQLKNGLSDDNQVIIDAIQNIEKGIDEKFEALKHDVIAELKDDCSPTPEKEIALKKSVKDLIEFLDSGGEVDYPAVESGDEAVQSDIAELRAELKRLKEEKSQLLLVHSKESE